MLYADQMGDPGVPVPLLTDTRGPCRLCRKLAVLRESHVIPRFVTDWMKRTGTPYLRYVVDPNRRRQDGRKVRLLCDDCEQRFSRVEGWFNLNFFKPYVDERKLKFQYGPELYRFLLSILWRVAATTDADPRFSAQLEQTCSEWQAALLEERAPRFCDGIFLFLTDIGTLDGEVPVVNFNRYMARAVDATIANNQNDAFVYAKLARFIVVGEITPIQDEWLENARVSPTGGTYRTDGVVMRNPISEFLMNRAAEAHQRYERGLSDRERERIDATTRKHGPRLRNSDLAAAIHADHIAHVDPSPMISRMGRNERCPCGSGKKFKRCHGA